jgi:lauroyl/myristoyl acyltransferase
MEQMPSAPAHPEASGSRTLRAAGFTIALGFRAIPEKLRFRAAVVVARWLEPLIGRTRGYEERSRLRTDDLRETSLELLLMTLTRHQTTFDPILRIDGAEHLPAAKSGATLIVSRHTMLSTLFLRHLEDAGHEPLVISADQDMRVPGRRMPARVLRPSPDLLLKVRRHLEDGRTIAAMIDRGRLERRSSIVQTAGGPVFVSEALLRLGLRYRARVVFLATTMDEMSRVVSRLSAPSSRSNSVREIVADFADFVDETQQIGRPRTQPTREDRARKRAASHSSRPGC